MAEIISAIVTGAVALLELIVTGMVFLAEQSVTVIGYACSKSYREQKNVAWSHHNSRKHIALGFSSLCLILLVSFVAWAAVEISGWKAKGLQAHEAKPHLKFEVHAQDKDGKTLKVSVKESGISNVMTARSLKELSKKMKESVVFSDDTNVATNYPIQFQASASSK